MRKVLSIFAAAAVSIAAIAGTLAVPMTRAQAAETTSETTSEADELTLLYSFDFSHVPTEYTQLNGHKWASDEKRDVYTELLKTQMTDMGWVLGTSFQICNYSSSRFYQTVPGEFSESNLYNGTIVENYPFFLAAEQYTSFYKSLKSNEKYIKIYVDPAQYYNNGRINNIGDGSENYTELITRSEDVNLAINGNYISDNLTGLIEYDMSSVDMLVVTRGTATVIYKIEVYGTTATDDVVSGEITGGDSSNSATTTDGVVSDSTTTSETRVAWIDNIFGSLGVKGLTMTAEIVLLVAAIVIIIRIVKK
jgi:hypothetical protein